MGRRGREGGWLREKMQPPRCTRTKTPNPGEGSPPPHLPHSTRIAAQQHAHTTAHAAPALHMLCTGGRGEEGRHTHARPAPPPTHTHPTSVSLKNRRRVHRFIYRVERTGVKHQQVPGVWSRGYRVCVCGVCEEGALAHTHITSHHINQTPAGVRCQSLAPPAPGQARPPGRWAS